jgi:hypothetical protein
MPCFCNSISTRLFSASNCCRLETCVGACRACAAEEGVTGSVADAAEATDAPVAGWIAPVQTCAPTACEADGAAAADETPAGAEAAPDIAPEAAIAASLPADGALVPAPVVTELA